MLSANPYPSTLPLDTAFYIDFTSNTGSQGAVIFSIFYDAYPSVPKVDIYAVDTWADVGNANFLMIANVNPSGVMNFSKPVRRNMLVFLPVLAADAKILNCREIRIWKQRDLL